jgi:hypothetical protein
MKQYVSALPALVVLLLANPSEAQYGLQESIATSNAAYQIRESSQDSGIWCVYKRSQKLTCLQNDYVYFGDVISTKDYNLIPVFDDCGGSACGIPSVTLIIEKGRTSSIHAISRDYSSMGDLKPVVQYNNNIAYLTLNRVDGNSKVAVQFNNGSIIVGKAPLSANESFKETDCSWLYHEFLDGCLQERGASFSGQRCIGVTDRMAMVYERSLGGMSQSYAGFPMQELQRLCDAVCAANRKPPRASFERQICRR